MPDSRQSQSQITGFILWFWFYNWNLESKCLIPSVTKSDNQVHSVVQITVLQLSALLKQADSSKRKLTLTRLASAPVPFTVLSLTGNPCKEDYLAVCGLKVSACQTLFQGAANISSKPAVFVSSKELARSCLQSSVTNLAPDSLSC